MSHPQQAPSLRPSAAWIKAAAQPTPACTVNASSGQFRAQAPHSMQASGAAIRTLLASLTNTARGQT